MITDVAIRRKVGALLVTYSLPAPYRHHDIIRKMVEDGVEIPVTKGCDQGFLIHSGEFLDRYTAFDYALEHRQIKGRPVAPPKLYSEDLW